MQRLLRLFEAVGRLKIVERKGWVRNGLPDPESVADHCYRAAMLALILGPKLDVNVDRVVRLCLAHDLAESDPEVGDITPHCGVSPEEKHARETAAIERLCAGTEEGELLQSLSREYQEGTSPEAHVAKQLDALEMALQSGEYEKRHGVDLGEFRESARRKIDHPVLLEILDRISEDVSSLDRNTRDADARSS